MRSLRRVQPTGCVWEREFSDVGFIDFTISVEKECTLDVLNTDHRGLYGAIREIPTAPATIWLRAAIT